MRDNNSILPTAEQRQQPIRNTTLFEMFSAKPEFLENAGLPSWVGAALGTDDMEKSVLCTPCKQGDQQEE